MPFSILIAVYLLLVGLVVGSYLNVVIHRLPLGISTVTPPSSCPRCGERVRARDNVPVLSYLLLRGRCRHCGLEIAPRYPLIEACTALLFVACFWRFGISIDLLAAVIFCSMMVALGAIDAEHYLLPDKITLPGIVIGLVLSPWVSWTSWQGAVLGAALGGGMLWALAKGWVWLRGEEGMGLGDVKMLALMGAFLGWKVMLVALFVAAVGGTVVGLTVIALGRGSLKTQLPFGTFLAVGGLVALFIGPAVSSYYQGLL